MEKHLHEYVVEQFYEGTSETLRVAVLTCDCGSRVYEQMSWVDQNE